MTDFSVKAAPCKAENTATFGDVRVSVITDEIVRIERSPGKKFEDRASQAVVCRNFANPQFKCEKIGDKVLVETNAAKYEIDCKTLEAVVTRGGKRTRAGEGTNLKGTARTLDFSLGNWKLDTGRVKVGDGVFATSGVTEIDDSETYLLNEDGTLSAREEGSVDKYVLAFGDDYLGGLKQFYGLTGATPVLPKYALGNWWSRYHVYTQEEYVALMDKFREKDIPLTVATIDMDWHIVKNVPADVPKIGNPLQSKGWTGYTFEKSLFPDYKQFFKDLKARGLAITMNLHPRDGIRYFEVMYPEMARANGIDPASKKPVEFDFTDMRFVRSYFDLVMHPYENDGVDFWWIDWQQGTKSKLEGLDPLWLLNHYHTLDSGREGRTPLILSRYAGVGSHRYPLGFSGDSIVSWKCLKIQPDFTATASNIGYGWWSHDIGGHMFGKGNAELYTRWAQFGVFSPIMRLHSNNKGWSKEPWLYGERAEKIVTEFMRLRHRLLPYLYTANIEAANGTPIMLPTYYIDKSSEAYAAKAQYVFGSEMLVAPIVASGKDGTVTRTVYLPAGEWTDFFTGEKFMGGKTVSVTCPLERIPVFVKAGSVIPLLAERKGNSQKFDELEVRVYLGCGSYRMYDENSYVDFAVNYDGKTATFVINPSENCLTKKLRVVFADVKSGDISAAGKTVKGGNTVDIEACGCTVTLSNIVK